MEGLGITLTELGQSQEARVLLEKAVAVRESTLSEKGQTLATCLSDLGKVLYDLGDYRNARQLNERALEIQGRVLRRDHPEIATILQRLGDCEVRLGEYQAARGYCDSALCVRTRSLPPLHSDLGESYERLAQLQGLLGKFTDAKVSCERAVSILQGSLGVDHPRTLSALQTRAELLLASGEYREAQSLLQRVLNTRIRALGESHRATASSRLVLAICTAKMGRYTEGRILFGAALAALRETIGEMHPDYLAARGSFTAFLGESGNLIGAGDILRELLPIQEQVLGDHHPDLAKTLMNYGHFMVVNGQWAAGGSYFERALEILQSVYPEDNPEAAKALTNLSMACAGAGDLAKGLPLMRRALEMQERVLGPDHPDLRANLYNLGTTALKSGNAREARRLLERAVAIGSGSVDSGQWMQREANNALGVVYYQLGEYNLALQCLETAREGAERELGPDDPSVGRLLQNVGAVLLDMGEYGAAVKTLDQALGLLERTRGTNTPDLAYALTNMGCAQMKLGEFRSAQDYMTRALRIREDTFGRQHPSVAETLNDLGALYYELGDTASARKCYEEANAIVVLFLGPDHSMATATLNNLAILRFDAGDLVGARRIYAQVLPIKERTMGPDHPSVAISLHNLANVERRLGNCASARALYEKALQILEQGYGEMHPLFAMELHDLAVLLWRCGSKDEAFVDAIRASELSREQLRLVVGGLPERYGLKFSAASAAVRDLPLSLVAEGIGSRERVLALDQVIRTRSIVLDEMVVRLQIASDEGGAGNLKLVEELARRREHLANLLVRGPSTMNATDFLSLVMEAREQKERAETELAKISERMAEAITRREIGLAEVLRTLPRGAAIASYVCYSRIEPLQAVARDSETPAGENQVRSYIALCARAGNQDVRAVPLGPASLIDDAVRRWRTAMVASQRGEAAVQKEGDGLRKLIWDPVLPCLGDAAMVFLVPDGALQLVNFAALPARDGGYLVEENRVLHYLSVERDLVPAKGRKAGREGLLAVGGVGFGAHVASTSAMAVLADEVSTVGSAASPGGARRGGFEEHPSVVTLPNCDEFRSTRFGPLPLTENEVDSIAATWLHSVAKADGNLPDSTMVVRLVGDSATERAVKGNVHDKTILHFATHGFSLSGSCVPMAVVRRGADHLQGVELPELLGEDHLLALSGLALAGANNRAEIESNEDDGVLTAEEIAALDLRGVEMVVLSACDSGVGEVLTGEGVLGLRRAFALAGAPTQIVSLWSVEDESSNLWMISFYKARFEEKRGIAEATRIADHGVLEYCRKTRGTTHPFYWGPFVSVGDWR